jgi:ribosomal protein L11 methyltransferase
MLSDILIAELADAGVESFEEEDGILNAYLRKNDFDKSVLDRLSADNAFIGTLTYSVEEIKSANWNNVWESNFEPVVIADKCVVYASFHRDLPDAACKILINPKMTFGTGHHETTHLCVEAIMSLNIEGKTFLDMGCGTGILGILAAVRGASSVTAIDNDPTAVENAVENAAINNVSDKTDIFEGNLLSIENRKFDIIVANINRNVLLDDMEGYVKSLNKNGILIISGFYREDIPVLTDRATSLGLSKNMESVRNKWAVVMYLRDSNAVNNE